VLLGYTGQVWKGKQSVISTLKRSHLSISPLPTLLHSSLRRGNVVNDVQVLWVRGEERNEKKIGRDARFLLMLPL
jgi:hypothetical protein